MSLTLLLPIAVFALFAALAWLAVDWFSSKSNKVEQRLDDFKDPTSRGERALEKEKSSASVKKMLEKAAPSLAKPLQPKTEKEVGVLRQRLQSAGFRGESAPNVFLGLKFGCLLVGLFVSGGTVLFTGSFSQSTLLKAGAVAGLMFYIPDVFVWFMARKRKTNIFLGLPDALDLMVVCVEAGLGLDQAMRKVAEEMKKSYRVLSDEFAMCNMQLQMGRSRTQVLQELGSRTQVEDLQTLASILIQADKFGSSIADALRVQSDAMRVRRSQIAEEKAAKTAVKLIFPLVIFIFPGIFVVLVGPAAITMIREMFPMMNGG